jgi:DNA-binding transcriptional LysR family regulator
MPDARRLPPLDLLLTFESAARHLSFTRAAEERFVTQSAVSRQIRALEDDLGVPLFRRAHRSLALTDEGRALAVVCTETLARLREAVERARAPRTRRVLTLSTTPGMASLWLIPRLARFVQRQPGVDVRLDVSFDRRDLVQDAIDVAIRLGRVDAPEGVKLFDEEVLPVCSPSLLGPYAPPLAAPADLARHTLLRMHDVARGPLQDWEPWLTAMGLPELEPRATLTFSNYDEVIAAAMLGQGVALGRRPLVDALLEDGRLVAPFKDAVGSPRAYFVVLNPASGNRPEARALVDWLLDEAREARGG